MSAAFAWPSLLLSLVLCPEDPTEPSAAPASIMTAGVWGARPVCLALCQAPVLPNTPPSDRDIEALKQGPAGGLTCVGIQKEGLNVAHPPQGIWYHSYQQFHQTPGCQPSLAPWVLGDRLPCHLPHLALPQMGRLWPQTSPALYP